ncbi:stress response NST1-like protein [Actinidia rufa]|uniref:Stress response NST1-like protein n=1 Tax=Actinidia rufa TaxID=165716 RepID=A0A7J0ERH2_9ERIC|nr:stress response NST1-like protein [Actinidia rufa]
MEEDRESPTATPELQNGDSGKTASFHDPNMYSDDIDSTCSTPYVSAPSSPGRGGGFFYSAPASPMHFVLCSPSPNSKAPVASASASGSFEFDFSARFGTIGSAMAGSMSSADELFLNGQIRPMKLSTHLKRPQMLAPLIALDETEGDCENVMDDEAEKFPRGRDVKWRDRSLRRRTRSMSPLRTSSFNWHESDEEYQKADKVQSSAGNEEIEIKENEAASGETTPSMSASSSRSSSVSRSSKRWVFLKEFLYRSKSEGRNNGNKFWTSISFSPVKDRKAPAPPLTEPIASSKGKTSNPDGGNSDKKAKKPKKQAATTGIGRPANGVGKRRVPASAHELHYKANRAQAEEMRKKTFLPYRQGLLGCLGFSSKSYGAMNGFARALNPVSSR